MTIVINPTTRVGELLDAFPELEATLKSLSPSFQALSNPLLRRTVARVATLEQAARVGGLPVPDLVHALRRAAGQEGDEVTTSSRAEQAVPAWAESAAPAVTLDAETLLSAGRTPVAEAAERLAGMSPGEVLELTSPFEPAPLIDALRAKGHEVYVVRAGDAFRVLVRRRP